MPNIHLAAPMQDYAQAQIRSGAYATLSVVVRDGMRLLMEKEGARQFYQLRAYEPDAYTERACAAAPGSTPLQKILRSQSTYHCTPANADAVAQQITRPLGQPQRNRHWQRNAVNKSLYPTIAGSA